MVTSWSTHLSRFVSLTEGWRPRQPTSHALFPYWKANGNETPVLPLNDEDIVFPEQYSPKGKIGWLTSRSTTIFFYFVTKKSVIKKKLGCKWNDKMSFLRIKNTQRANSEGWPTGQPTSYDLFLYQKVWGNEKNLVSNWTTRTLFFLNKKNPSGFQNK